MEKYRKKLIEVALPLEEINHGCQQEKNPFLKGHPRSLHLWWSRKPLSACRAVLFASIVDDPSSRPDLFPTEEEQDIERQRLFRLIAEFVKWENTTNESVLEGARTEILRATNGNPPAVLDPFCGGGSIPLEAQRLGLEAHASDLNPVAALITKALIELPSRFAGKPPVNPEARAELSYEATWTGALGLAEDVRYYATWMRDRARERVGHLYPKARLEDGSEAEVIAWLWVRTVVCPNPACGTQMPLSSKFRLATKRGKEWYVQPVVDDGTLRFEVCKGKDAPDGTVSRSGARCIVCQQVAPLKHVRSEAQAGRMGLALMAIVAKGERSRIFLPSTSAQVAAAAAAEPAWGPEELVTTPSHDVDRLPMYGMNRWRDAFTPRQLMTLTVLCDLVEEAHQRILADGGEEDYADAVATYLAFAVGHMQRYSSMLCAWNTTNENVAHAFGRQALPIVWDFAEANAVEGVLDVAATAEWVIKALSAVPANPAGVVSQLDASSAGIPGGSGLVCTDPPYYDNISYADLTDFFYVWLRRSLGQIYPDLFSTLLTPKRQELVATPYRFDGDRGHAERFFEEGLHRAFTCMRESQHPDYPLVLFYAFKQSESTEQGVSSTGWETMLSGLLASGLAVTGTWPVRSERDQGLKTGTNVLASSILLACRIRDEKAPIATRRELVRGLRAELPYSLKQLQHGNIAPVDLAQAAIGPGMAVFSRYAKVLEADGSAMTVRSALSLINQTLDEILAEQEGDFDADTRFAVTWFEQRGTAEGPYGEADVLARAKDTSVDGMVEAGVLFSHAGKVRLLRRDEMPGDWDPVTDRRPTAWEAAQHLTRRLQTGGEAAAADLLRRLGAGYGEQARELAYRLYSICERKGWAQEALPYNALVVAWPEIARGVAGTPEAEAQQVLEV